MELKVWVDGIQRVVCGVSEQTTCQEVVIALARAMGQTGRYVLVQRLREKERQLLPLECPLESLAKCGQYANDVQFVLRRTGPSVVERPSSEGAPQAPERTFIRASLPIKPRLAGTDPPRSREPRKSMTFNLGPTGSTDLLAMTRWRHQTREGLELEGVGVAQPSKEELFRRVLRQQEQLHCLEAQGDSLESDLRLWERERAGGQERELEQEEEEEEVEEILYLEQLVRRNETELGQEEFWQSELQLEQERERERQQRVRSLRASLQDYTQRIGQLGARTQALQEQIRWEMAERAKRGKEPPVPGPAELEDMAAKMKRDLEAKVKQSTQLESSLASVEKALEEAERNLQAQTQELEELNKELRQCNLQQFIQQTGATVTVLQARPDQDAQPEPGPRQLPACWRNGGFPPSSGTDSPPRASAQQPLSHPRTLPEPLVPSINPEVVPTRQSIWR